MKFFAIAMIAGASALRMRSNVHVEVASMDTLAIEGNNTNSTNSTKSYNTTKSYNITYSTKSYNTTGFPVTKFLNITKGNGDVYTRKEKYDGRPGHAQEWTTHNNTQTGSHSNQFRDISKEDGVRYYKRGWKAPRARKQ